MSHSESATWDPSSPVATASHREWIVGGSRYSTVHIGLHNLLIDRVTQLKETEQSKHRRCELFRGLGQASLDLL